MSELPLHAPGANPGVRATFASASESLTSDQAVDLCRVSRRTIRSRLNRLELHTVGAHARHPDHYSGMSPDHCLGTGMRIADLSWEGRDARAQRLELHTGVALR